MSSSVRIAPRARRPGLTLMELVIVLLVLIGIAGILLPVLPNMTGRTENSTGATNHQEIAKWVQAYEGLFLEYPNDWDALTDGAGGKIGYVRGELDVVVDATGLLQGEADSMTRNGITRLQKMVAASAGFAPPPPNHRTFDPYVDADYATNGMAIAKDAKLLILKLSGQKKLGVGDGITDAGKFVVLGLGKRCTLIGRLAINAPVAFKERGVRGPDDVYCRFAAVYQVSSPSNPTGFPGCRFVGTCNFKANDKGIFTAEHDIEDYYRLENNTVRP